MWQQQQQYLRNLPSQHSQQQTLHPGIIDTDDHPHQSHHQHHHQHHQHHRTTIMNLPVPSNPRASRNMAEKQRRDNLNTNITNMAALVPIVAESSRKMDKISILRLAAAFLRTQYILGRGSTNSLPRQFNEFDLEQYFVDHIVDNGGFFLVLTAEGKIVYISRQVEQHLGYAQNELLGQSLYLFVYSEDHNELSRNLTPDGMQPMTPPSTGVVQAHDLVHDSSSSSSEDSTTNRINEKKKLFHEQRRNFKIRIAQRANSRRENTQYACFDISGVLRLAEACKNTDTNGNRGRHREVTSTKNDIVFVGVATFPRKRPINELSIMDANKDEYVTRHLIDGRIIFCDHRVSIVAGYMSEEVSGLNAFAFMHKNDCRWTMIGLRQMYDHADVSSCGSSCYRLLAKTGEFIYLRTHGYLEYEKGTKDVISFVCVNTLVSEDEGIQLIKEMKERFSATVSTVGYKNLIKNVDINSAIEMDSSSQSSNPRYSLEDPSQLEDAINHLINNMPSPAVSEDHFLPSPMQHTQYVKAALFSSRMPPVAAQANKIGINKIDHYIVIKGKGNRTPKQEPKEEYTNIGKYMNSSSAEQSPMSDTESVKSCTKPLILDMMNGGHNNHNNVQNADVSVQSNILANTRNTNNCRGVSRNHTSCLDVSQNTNGLNGQKRIEQRNSIMSPGALHESNIKLECEIETKQEPVLQYFDDRASDSSIVSPGIEATHNRCTLKRICSDEDLPTIHSKKRSNDALYMSTNPNDEQQQQRISYVNCETFATQNKYSAVEFNRYNDANLQPLITTAESPNSSLEIGKEYQQLVVDPTASLVVTNSDVQFDLRDLKDDTLLNSDLNANPELMLKIFNGLHNGPMTGFENRYNETKLQQFAPSHQTVVNDKLRRTYRQIASNITLQESQISMLANDFENPILHAQRKNLSQLQVQVEHNIQKRILKTLQQDHHKIQVNAKHNLGI